MASNFPFSCWFLHWPYNSAVLLVIICCDLPPAVLRHSHNDWERSDEILQQTQYNAVWTTNSVSQCQSSAGRKLANIGVIEVSDGKGWIVGARSYYHLRRRFLPGGSLRLPVVQLASERLEDSWREASRGWIVISSTLSGVELQLVAAVCEQPWALSHGDDADYDDDDAVGAAQLFRLAWYIGRLDSWLVWCGQK